jgi:hypothetical protein
MMDDMGAILMGDDYTTHLATSPPTIRQVRVETTTSPIEDSFYDESYIQGKRNNPDLRDVSRFVNTSARPIPTYSDVFTAELTTLSAIDTHENCIYKAGYTPNSAIQDSIHNILETTSTHDHIVNFHERDIPPKNRDPVTFQTLHNLACERNRLDNDFSLMVEHGDGHDASPDVQRAYEQDYIQRDQQYNRINR